MFKHEQSLPWVGRTIFSISSYILYFSSTSLNYLYKGRGVLLITIKNKYIFNTKKKDFQNLVQM